MRFVSLASYVFHCNGSYCGHFNYSSFIMIFCFLLLSLSVYFVFLMFFLSYFIFSPGVFCLRCSGLQLAILALPFHFFMSGHISSVFSDMHSYVLFSVYVARYSYTQYSHRGDSISDISKWCCNMCRLASFVEEESERVSTYILLFV